MSTDTKTLSERLRKAAEEMRADNQNGWPVLTDAAADALDAKDALLREAANVMRPIAAIADAVFAKYEAAPGIFREVNSGRPDCQAVWGFDRADLTYGDLRRARTLLSKLTEATKP